VRLGRTLSWRRLMWRVRVLLVVMLLLMMIVVGDRPRMVHRMVVWWRQALRWVRRVGVMLEEAAMSAML
jgi:hypothetical protein